MLCGRNLGLGNDSEPPLAAAARMPTPIPERAGARLPIPFIRGGAQAGRGEAYRRAKIVIAPMIGLNDVSPEDFTLADAQTVANFTAGNSATARLAYWPVARDNASGIGYVGASSSGIAQTPYHTKRR